MSGPLVDLSSLALSRQSIGGGNTGSLYCWLVCLLFLKYFFRVSITLPTQLESLTDTDRNIWTGAARSMCSSRQDLGWDVIQANTSCIE